MQEIVINKCFGGFGLSPKAYSRYLELKGKKAYFFTCDWKSKEYDSVSEENAKEQLFFTMDIPNPNDLPREESNKHIFSYWDIKRDDPDLVKTIRELGNDASGNYAKLRIVEVPDGVRWEVSEYDGMETIDEVHQSWG